MTHVRRLLAVSAVLAIPAAFTLSHHLWGDSGKKDFQKVTPPAAAVTVAEPPVRCLFLASTSTWR